MTNIRRHLAILNIALLLIAVYIPLFSPIASQAGSTGGVRYGFNPSAAAGNSDGMYADLLMLANFNASTTTPLNSQGYPIAVGVSTAGFLGLSGGYPNGNYQFYGEGEFTCAFNGGGIVNAGTNQGFNPGTLKTTTVNGKTITTGLVNIQFPAFQAPTYSSDPNDILLGITVTPTNANNLPANLHLMRPDVPAWYDGWTNDNSIFGKEFIQALSGHPQPKKLPTAAQQEAQSPLFCCIRFLGWMWDNPSIVTGPYGTEFGVANNYGVVNWADRPSPTFFASWGRSICYENMIELCNELNCDMWINIPLYAAGGMDGNSPSDWCANMATLVKQKLHPNLHCYYEIADELWNWGAGSYWYDWKQVDVWAQANPNLAFLGGGWQQHGGEMGVLIMNAEQQMQPILGDQGRPVLPGFIVDTSYCTGGLKYIAQAFGPPAKYIYGIAGSFYFTWSLTDPASTSAEQSLLDYISQTMQTQFNQHIALAQQYGVKFCGYEGGQGLEAWDQPSFEQYEAIQSASWMTDCYQALAMQLAGGGSTVDTCCWLGFCGNDGQYGFWGAMQDIRQMYNNPPSVKYAIEASIAAGCSCGTAVAAPLTLVKQKANAEAAAKTAAAAKAKAVAGAAKAKAEAAAAKAKAKAKAEAAAAKAKAKEEAEAKAAAKAAALAKAKEIAEQEAKAKNKK